MAPASKRPRAASIGTVFKDFEGLCHSTIEINMLNLELVLILFTVCNIMCEYYK